MTRDKPDHDRGTPKRAATAKDGPVQPPPGGFGQEARQHALEIEKARKDVEGDSSANPLPLVPMAPD